jgi:hypothetical protein
MKRGRQPKPTTLHRVHGTYRPARHEARLEPVAPGDLAPLVAFVVAGDLVEQANAAQQLLDRGKALPFLTKSDKGLPTLSPYVRLMLRAVPMLLRAASELAFTPVSRASITIDAGAGKTSSNAERWALFDSLGKPKKGDQAELLAAKPASAQPQ